MKIEMKLYASLARYLPTGAKKHAITLDVAEGMTPAQLIEERKLPKEACFLVFLNGVYLSPGEHENRAMQEGDALAMWPPIAGG